MRLNLPRWQEISAGGIGKWSVLRLDWPLEMQKPRTCVCKAVQVRLESDARRIRCLSRPSRWHRMISGLAGEKLTVCPNTMASFYGSTLRQEAMRLASIARSGTLAAAVDEHCI